MGQILNKIKLPKCWCRWLLLSLLRKNTLIENNRKLLFFFAITTQTTPSQPTPSHSTPFHSIVYFFLYIFLQTTLLDNPPPFYPAPNHLPSSFSVLSYIFSNHYDEWQVFLFLSGSGMMIQVIIIKSNRACKNKRDQHLNKLMAKNSYS